MISLLKAYKDRVGRLVMLTKNKETKEYTINYALGNTFTSFTFKDRELFKKEVRDKYKPELKKKK